MEEENNKIQIDELSSSLIDLSSPDLPTQPEQQKMSSKDSGKNQSDVVDLKRKLESWKFILLPVNNLLEWEHKFDPFVIIFLNILLFGLLMFYNPSTLTTVSILGLVVLLFESVVPLLNAYLFKSTEWDPVSESKYTRICERISNFQQHVLNAKNKLETTRKEKQPLYFLIVFFFLIFCAYVGQSVDNLLLTFLAVLVLTLTPGARRHRIVPRTWNKIKTTIGIGKSKLTVKEISSKLDGNSVSSTEVSSTSYEFNKNK